MESDLMPMVPSALPAARHVLALAPHADDEVFGCGGTLHLLAKSGAAITVIVATDGALGGMAGEGGSAALVAAREAETRAAAALLGYPAPVFWRLPDRGLRYGEALVARLLDAMQAAHADLVFAPALTELHPDHQVLALAAAEALRRLGGERRVAFYEVSAPLLPNTLIDITACEEQKRSAMRCFRSQLAEQPYDERIAALNRYRGYTLGADVRAAEAFFFAMATELATGLGLTPLFESAFGRRRRLGLAVDGADLPLVSVIVRSMDRPTLAQALASVAAQTYPNIEVVVVNAKGGRHSPLPDLGDRLVIRLIEKSTPLERSCAANAGLDASCGVYVALLDDDDTLDPDHLGPLVATLRKEGNGVVAYSGVRCMDRNDPEHKISRVFGEAFESRAKLLAGNFIPSHAVLLPRRLVEDGARFDETLDVYEDWDFWLQVSQVARFVYVDRITATYYTGGKSGVSPLAFNPEVAHLTARALFAKWKDRITPDELKGLSDLYHRTKAELFRTQEEVRRVDNEKIQLMGERDTQIQKNNELIQDQARQLHEKIQLIGERDTQIQRKNELIQDQARQLHHQARQLQDQARQLQSQSGRLLGLEYSLQLQLQQIQAFYSSSSWRITRPLRWAAMRLKKIKSLVSTIHSSSRPAHEQNDVLQYDEWIELYDPAPDAAKRAAIKARIGEIARHPLISILLPLPDLHGARLRDTIKSVFEQSYGHWELCIAVTSPDVEAAVRRMLDEYRLNDQRLKLTCCENHHRARAAALNLATGEFIGFLCSGDALAENALYCLVMELVVQPDADILYSDEDVIDENGRRFDPYFKPDWNPDLIACQDFVSGFALFRTVRVSQTAGLQEQYGSAQEWDLSLRISESTATVSIRHIPRVLYHRRKLDGGIMPAAREFEQKVLAAHFERIGTKVELYPAIDGYWRIKYPVPEPAPLVSLIIPTRNRYDVLSKCVESILHKTTYPNFELIIVDNQSDERAALNYLKSIAAQPRVRVLQHDAAFNYSAINNYAVAQAKGTVIGLINNDVEVITPTWLDELVAHALRPEIGAVGAKLYYPDGRIQHAGVILGLGGVAGHAYMREPGDHRGQRGRAMLTQTLSAVTAACLVIRKQLFAEVGGLDEANLPVAFNDIDLCMRLREKGYRNLWTPYAELYHHESASRGTDDAGRKQERFRKETHYMNLKWGGLLFRDPAYNPNLTLARNDFSIGHPRVQGL